MKQRIFALTQRVIRQIFRDGRTVILLIIVPMFVLSLGAALFRSEPAQPVLGIINNDTGATTPMTDKIFLGNRLVDTFTTGEAFSLTMLEQHEIDRQLSDGIIEGVLIIPEDFSFTFLQNNRAKLELRVEGSNPSRSMFVYARVNETAMKTFAGLASGISILNREESAELPVEINISYLYAGESFDTLDFVAPVYIAFLVLFFVFVLTCVSFIRERTQGTFERLMSTPANRFEIVFGYMTGLGLFALVQAAVIILFTILVIRINYLGSLTLLFLIVSLLAVVGVTLGILASAFARTEYQVVQFIPLLIIPQALLGGIFWPIEEMPMHLQIVARFMPITYANNALRDVMIKGWGFSEIWPDLAILSTFAVMFLALGTLTMRREV